MFQKTYNKLDIILKYINKHPTEKNMTYIEHFKHAIHMSYKLAYASVSVFIHAIYPPVNQNTASDIIKKLHSQL